LQELGKRASEALQELGKRASELIAKHEETMNNYYKQIME
jgi:hypothetical protein